MAIHAALATLAAALTLAPVGGGNLEYCGNKYCGVGAVCNKDTKCECSLAEPFGDPVFRCHPDTTVSCVLVGDPSILGFAGSLTFLDFPCKVNLATRHLVCCDTCYHDNMPTERGTPADKQTRRQTNTQTDRQTDTQTKRYTDRLTDRHAERHSDRQTDSQIDRLPDRLTASKIHRHTDTQTDSETDRLTHRHRLTYRHSQIDRLTDRHTHKQSYTHTHRQTHRQSGVL